MAQDLPVDHGMRIAILGWGSLLWETDTDRAEAFDKHREKWCDAGPHLRLEFSRISASRRNGLTFGHRLQERRSV